ncbi:MAG: oligosaccharide flippase family protein [Nitritalea sp.]
MEAPSKAGYGQILKSTSLFGGVQAVSILTAILRAKVMAVLLGTNGMGLLGLIQTALELIGAATNFGLSQSAVRDISLAAASEKPEKVQRAASIFRKIVWATGLLGAGTTLLLAYPLSLWMLEDPGYTWAFMWLGASLLFNQLAVGQTVLLQGLRQLKWMAQANLYGTVLSLFVTLPIYYVYEIQGIVPAILGQALLTFLIARYFGKKIALPLVHISWKEAWREGSPMLKFGLALNATALITLGFSLLIRIFINRSGGTDDVGLYAAGFNIMNTYVGLIFNAMGADYYPKLAGVAENKEKAKGFMSQQGEVSLLILMPLLTFLALFLQPFVRLIYTPEFLPIVPMLHIAFLGMLLKTGGWVTAFYIVAKGKTKFFFWSELLYNGYFFASHILGYRYFGIPGLGMAFTVSYALYFVQVSWIVQRFYGIRLEKAFFRLLSLALLLVGTAAAAAHFLSGALFWALAVPLCLGTALFCFRSLDKRSGLATKLVERLKRFFP